MRNGVLFFFTALVSAGCCSADKGSSASLPSPGADAWFAGSYPGTFSWVASLSPAAGAAAPQGTEGVVASTLAADDTTSEATLPANGLVLHVNTAGAGECDLTGSIDARRYDPSGGYVQLPLTIASATLDQGSVCAFPVDGGNTLFRVESSDLKLYADGSLELRAAGPVETWPSSSVASGTFELTFFGQRLPPNAPAGVP